MSLQDENFIGSPPSCPSYILKEQVCRVSPFRSKLNMEDVHTCYTYYSNKYDSDNGQIYS